MTSRQHQDWINRGKPDSGLALPLQLLANTLAAAGYTVYVYPNDAHLDAEPPEDHTYYAETGWPHASPKWWRHAIDIMPPPADKPHLPSLTTLGQTIFNARQAGQIAWLKYMNWPSTGSLQHAVQDRWEPTHARGSSSDTGHIHLSSITGVEVLDAPYNPLTSVVLADSVTEDDMSALFTDNLARELDAMFNAKDTVLLDTGGGVMKPFQVPLVALIKASAAPVDVQALAAALAPQLGVDAEAVVAALQSDAGQAALVQAANRAEDS